MCRKVLRSGIRVCLLVCFVALGVNRPASATDHWWHGGVSADLNDPSNWTDRNAGNDPTAPTGNPRDIVRIGGSWGTEDLNGNGVLDAGEDLNGNGVIDNPIPGGGVGYGGYGLSGGGVELAVNPVLSDTYVSRNAEGTAEIGWVFVLNYPNILTLKDGAFLIMSEANCNLRNGGRLEVQGRSNTGGPSLITAGSFRVAENGAIAEAAHETSQIRINGTGYMQVDASLEGGSSEKGTWFRIGTPETPGTMPRGEVIIEENGLLELLGHDGEPYILWGNADPQVNQIIIRDGGELHLYGDPANMGRVGDGDTVISLDDMVATGLIANDRGGVLTVSGSDPTVVKVSGVDNPSPTYANPDVPKDVVLRWDPDPESTAATYDVYLGMDLASVTEADRTNPLGVLKSQGQTQTYYPQAGALPLEFGQTYYWRVDTVTAPPNSTTFQGKLWYFTVEPFARLIAAEAISATASSHAEGQGPENTINGSGLDVDGLHSGVVEDMWLSEPSDPNSAWIQYDFDKPYKLHQMVVWNYNGDFLLTGFGLQDVTVAYSTDGVVWNPMDAVLAKAPGAAGYAANTTVEFGGVLAKMVRITAQTNWGNNPLFNQYGLSEVQFLSIPVSARQPNPESGATGVALDTMLNWRAGREAVEHRVHFGTDGDAVASGAALVDTVAAETYNLGALDLGTTYYWKIDEVNDAATPSVWEGPMWSFTTEEYFIVDDFESYTGDDGANEAIWQTWADGYGDATNGSQVGHDDRPYVETTVVRSGRQSMPLYYDNAAPASSSQADRSLSPAQDWTQSGITTLVVHFYGAPGNTGQLYVNIGNTTIPYPGAAADLATETWTAWEIDLASSGASLANVSDVSVGVDGSSASGLLYIDDVLLK